MSTESNPPRGIGGWLFLPALGVILSPISWALYLARVSRELFSSQMWSALTDRTSFHFQPLWPITRGFEVIGALTLLVFSIQIAFSFFQCRRKLPGRIVLYYLGYFLFAWLVVVLWSLPSLKGLIDPEQAGAIFRNAVRATITILIWVPYFTFSKRVRATFTRTSTLESPQQDPTPLSN